ncbi:hypothetical protein BDV93DRAFT_514565 [Ceratobasidium sp. AG-I]|nr:hypothetical protein BDV93DRAFT_514565 [Ceratobasidium sp. AG-I]
MTFNILMTVGGLTHRHTGGEGYDFLRCGDYRRLILSQCRVVDVSRVLSPFELGWFSLSEHLGCRFLLADGTYCFTWLGARRMFPTYPPNATNTNVPSEPREEQPRREVRLTLFRLLSITFPFVLHVSKVAVTAEGNNTASWILDLFSGLVAIGLFALGFVEPVTEQLPRRWYYYLYTHAIYTWRFNARNSGRFNGASWAIFAVRWMKSRLVEYGWVQEGAGSCSWN